MTDHRRSFAFSAGYATLFDEKNAAFRQDVMTSLMAEGRPKDIPLSVKYAGGPISEALGWIRDSGNIVRKFRTMLGQFPDIEHDVRGKFSYAAEMLDELVGFHDFLQVQLNVSDPGEVPEMIMNIIERVQTVLQMDASYEDIKSLEVWKARRQEFFEFANRGGKKKELFERVSNFYNAVPPCLRQIENKHANIGQLGIALSEIMQQISAAAQTGQDSAHLMTMFFRYLDKIIDETLSFTDPYIRILTAGHAIVVK